MMGQLTIEAIQDWLADVQFKPFAQEGWTFDAEADSDGGIILTLVNHFARDTRTFDFDAEFDDWTLLDANSQTFARPIAWPEDFDALAVDVAEVVAYAAAHEALEWLRIDGKMPHDPHEDGDVIVKLP